MKVTQAGRVSPVVVRRRQKTANGDEGKSKVVKTRAARPGSAKTEVRERILAASSRLLASKGLTAFNMNAVAALSEVDVPTLYSHFGDRVAILLELFERSVASRQSVVLAMLGKFVEAEDPIAWIQTNLTFFSELRYANSADIILRRSVRAIPELFEAEARSNMNYVVALETVLRSRMPRLDARRARGVARAIVESCTALLDYGALHPKDAKQMSEEMVMLVIGYLREVVTRYS